MKKSLTIAALIAAIGISASAQTPDQKPGMGKARMGIDKQTLMDSLKISQVTADSVFAIRQQTMSQMKSVMSDQSLTQDQKRDKLKPLKQEMKTRLKQFLTDDQAQKLQELEMAKRQNHGDQ